MGVRSNYRDSFAWLTRNGVMGNNFR